MKKNQKDKDVVGPPDRKKMNTLYGETDKFRDYSEEFRRNEF